MAIGKVGQFKEITVVYAATGPTTMQFFTDMPGGIWFGRLPGSGVTLPATGGGGLERMTKTIPLDGIEGTQFYPKFTPTGSTQFRLFECRAKAKLIGVHLDATATPQAEVWSPDPIAIGG